MEARLQEGGSREGGAFFHRIHSEWGRRIPGLAVLFEPGKKDRIESFNGAEKEE